jgi:hypothetical protein
MTTLTDKAQPLPPTQPITGRSPSPLPDVAARHRPPEAPPAEMPPAVTEPAWPRVFPSL